MPSEAIPVGKVPRGESRPSPNAIYTFPSQCASQCRQRPFPRGRSHTKMGKVSKTSLDLPHPLCLPVLSEAILAGKVPRGKSRPSPNAIDTFPIHCASQGCQRPFSWGRSHAKMGKVSKTSLDLPQPLCLPGLSGVISAGKVPRGKRRPSPNAIDTFPSHCASQGSQRPFPRGRSHTKMGKVPGKGENLPGEGRYFLRELRLWPEWDAAWRLLPLRPDWVPDLPPSFLWPRGSGER